MDTHSLECLDFDRVRAVLARYAMCGLGRMLIENIRPVTRVALVRRWLSQVGELQRLIESRGFPPFAGVSDIRELLPRCAPPLRVNVEEVAQIGATLAATHRLAAYLRDLPEEFPELRHLAERIGDFRTVADRIAGVIDERGQVRDSASPKLQRIRADIADAAGQITQTVTQLLRDAAVRRFLQYPSHTFHGDRLVLPLRTEYRGRLPGIVHRTSDSGATLYVEPAEVVELNNRISNLRSEEQEEIGRLLWDLAHEVHLNTREIRSTLEAVAVVDLIMAKVRFAKDFEARCPQINDDGTLSVRQARHPVLLELARPPAAAGAAAGSDEHRARVAAEAVVPIDYRLGVDFNLLVITGPNTGGKTVTLKTVGLLSLLVQAGVPVPVAAGSEFGVFSNILIDVGDEQSMQQSLSTFSGHITRITDMLRHAGPRALLLIDELGAGTDPDEGAAIGRAILDELLRVRCRAVVTTHLGALKGFALTRPSAENACVQFDAETLRPTYHLTLGEPGSSNAIEIANRLGLPKRLISAAQRNLSRKARVLQQAIEGTRVVKRQAENARREAEDARLAASNARAQADAARTQLERQQADFQQWVRRVVHLQTGDPVRVRHFDRDGRIVRMRLDQHRAEVDVGAFSVEVALGDILPPETPAPPPRPQPAPAPPPRRKERVRPPAGQAAGAAHGRPAPPQRPQRPPQRVEQRPRLEREPERVPALPPLTDEQAAALQPLDHVFVQRFRRVGRIVRVVPHKKLAVVDVGMLEVEVPFEGLALPSAPKRPPRPPAKPARPREPEHGPPAAGPEEAPPPPAAPPPPESASPDAPPAA